MQSSKPVRTYLDPDAVGPLPRSSMADDSDALAAARTIIRVPEPTQELSAQDMIEVFDPSGRGRAVRFGLDTVAFVLPRRRPSVLVASAILLAALVIAVAAARTPREAAGTPARVSAASPLPAVAAPAPSPGPSRFGTLRVEGAAGQAVAIDGAPLTAPAAVLACGPHEVVLGARTRTIDVPCGGEVTVYR